MLLRQGLRQARRGPRYLPGGTPPDPPAPASQPAPVRDAVTTTVAYSIRKLPPIASMAAPGPLQHLRQLVRRELGEGTEGGHLVQPLVPGVGPLPVKAPLLGFAELACRPDPIGDLGE